MLLHMMVLNIISSLLITLVNVYGFIPSNKNLKLKMYFIRFKVIVEKKTSKMKFKRFIQIMVVNS